MSDSSSDRRCPLYPWFEELGAELVHPEDLGRFKALQPNGRVFEIGESVDDYVCLLYAAKWYRVKPDLVVEVPRAKYRIGDRVKIREVDGVGEVVDVMWHHKEARPFFLIMLNGVRKSKRYWEFDFLSAA